MLLALSLLSCLATRCDGNARAPRPEPPPPPVGVDETAARQDPSTESAESGADSSDLATLQARFAPFRDWLEKCYFADEEIDDTLLYDGHGVPFTAVPSGNVVVGRLGAAEWKVELRGSVVGFAGMTGATDAGELFVLDARRGLQVTVADCTPVFELYWKIHEHLRKGDVESARRIMGSQIEIARSRSRSRGSGPWGPLYLSDFHPAGAAFEDGTPRISGLSVQDETVGISDGPSDFEFRRRDGLWVVAVARSMQY